MAQEAYFNLRSESRPLEHNCSSPLSFNGDVAYWDTSKVTSLFTTFGAGCPFNRDISRWDTSNVVTMASTFDSAVNFNADLSRWNTSKVTSLASMFTKAASLVSFKERLPSIETCRDGTPHEPHRWRSCFTMLHRFMEETYREGSPHEFRQSTLCLWGHPPLMELSLLGMFQVLRISRISMGHWHGVPRS